MLHNIDTGKNNPEFIASFGQRVSVISGNQEHRILCLVSESIPSSHRSLCVGSLVSVLHGNFVHMGNCSARISWDHFSQTLERGISILAYNPVIQVPVLAGPTNPALAFLHTFSHLLPPSHPCSSNTQQDRYVNRWRKQNYMPQLSQSPGLNTRQCSWLHRITCPYAFRHCLILWRDCRVAILPTEREGVSGADPQGQTHRLPSLVIRTPAVVLQVTCKPILLRTSAKAALLGWAVWVGWASLTPRGWARCGAAGSSLPFSPPSALPFPSGLWLGQGLPGSAPHHQRTSHTLSSQPPKMSLRATSELR